MRKLQYIIRPPVEPGPALERRVLDQLVPALIEASPRGLRVAVTAEPAPKLSLIPFRRRAVVLLSIWDGGDEPPERWTGLIGGLGAVQGYQVTEALPVPLKRSWPASERTPGVGLLTLFNRKPGLSDEELLRLWHEGHTPLSLRIHPLWSYLRNLVEDAVVPDSPRLDGIVEEHFREPADLLNPARLFGGPLHMLPNMLRVGLDIRGFMDLRHMENYFVHERRILEPDEEGEATAREDSSGT
jgi:hypothetical protein